MVSMPPAWYDASGHVDAALAVLRLIREAVPVTPSAQGGAATMSLYLAVESLLELAEQDLQQMEMDLHSG